jgi:DNA-binding NtrC family response regulator
MSTILIVDDSPRDCETYRAFLANDGLHQIAFCETGAQMLDSLGSADVALVIISWEFDGTPNAPETIVEIRHRHPKLPILVASGHLDLAAAAQAKAVGANDLLLKPLEKPRLLAAVDKALLGEPELQLLPELRSRLIGESPPFVAMLKVLARLIQQEADPVLLVGENGTGKELLARAIHDLSPRAEKPFVAVNAASIPPTLVESTLFGHEKGAFTGADSLHRGAFEQAENGTLFFDEIGELVPALQAHLLRVLQERKLRRVGGSEEISVPTSVVFATNRDLLEDVESGRFRRDLYYRISSHEVRVPPLRQRGGDVWLLADYFVRTIAVQRKVRLARETRTLLSTYPFEGNVRELRSLIQHSIVQCSEDEILPYHLPVDIMHERIARSQGEALHDDNPWPASILQLPYHDAVNQAQQMLDRYYLPEKLRKAKGVMTRAAKDAGIDPSTFRRRWKEAELPPVHSLEERKNEQ